MSSPGPWDNVSHHRQDFLNGEFIEGSVLTNLLKIRILLHEHFGVFFEEYFLSTRDIISSWKPDIAIVESMAWGTIDACIEAKLAFIVIGLSPLNSLDSTLPPVAAAPAMFTSVNHLTSTESTLASKIYHYFIKAIAPIFILDGLLPMLTVRSKYGFSIVSFAQYPLKALAYISMNSWTHSYPRLLPQNFHLVGPFLDAQEDFDGFLSYSKLEWFNAHSQTIAIVEELKSKSVPAMDNDSEAGHIVDMACAAGSDCLHVIENNSCSLHVITSLDEWLTTASCRGLALIFIAFGTQAAVDSRRANAIVSGVVTMLEETQGVVILWALPKDQMTFISGVNGSFSDLQHSLHPRLWIQDWVPQVDILRLPNTILFMSHCGMNSASEALLYSTPLICVPFFGDQPDNAARLLDFGHSLATLFPRDLTAASVRGALVTTIGNSSSMAGSLAHANRTAEIIRAEGGLPRAVSLVEFYMKYGPNWKLLEDPYSAVDLIVVYSLLLAVLVGLVFLAAFVGLPLLVLFVLRWIFTKYLS